eukprot:scaffold153613_cov19-Tisochrysis_lutea.AAC.1
MCNYSNWFAEQFGWNELPQQPEPCYPEFGAAQPVDLSTFSVQLSSVLQPNSLKCTNVSAPPPSAAVTAAPQARFSMCSSPCCFSTSWCFSSADAPYSHNSTSRPLTVPLAMAYAGTQAGRYATPSGGPTPKPSSCPLWQSMVVLLLFMLVLVWALCCFKKEEPFGDFTPRPSSCPCRGLFWSYAALCVVLLQL